MHTELRLDTEIIPFMHLSPPTFPYYPPVVSTLNQLWTDKTDSSPEALVWRRGSLNPRIRIAFDHINGFRLRANADQDIPPDLDLICTPHSLILPVRDYDRLGLEWPEAFTTRFAEAPEVLTRFLLIDQFLQDEDSFWWLYLDVLPRLTKSDGATFCVSESFIIRRG